MFARHLNRSLNLAHVAMTKKSYAVISQPSVVSSAAAWEHAIIRAQNSIVQGITSLWSPFAEGILFVKRTFQPSLIRMKRKHGFLARLRSRNGQKILERRREKGRTRLSN